MTWNHRVIKHVEQFEQGVIETAYAIHEVYYTPTGVPYAVTKNAVGVWSDSVLDLADVLEQMRAALVQPVLYMLDFKPGGKYYRETDAFIQEG
jgi:hypothetical protein